MRVDLHIHTTASDGSWNPLQLLEEIRSNDIGCFAVTDHESVANITAVSELAKNAGILFIPGVEISSTLLGHSFHILGYGIDPANPDLLRVLAHNTALLEEVDHVSIKKLIADGYDLDYHEYCNYQDDSARGGWKALNFLIDKGICRDMEDYFAGVFTAERGLTFPEFPSPAVVAEAILAAGGIPILAHPGSQFHGEADEEVLHSFLRAGIGGLECFHPHHDAQATQQALAWCIRHNLLITGGSDCHGAFVPKRKLGLPEIHLAQLRLGELFDRS